LGHLVFVNEMPGLWEGERRFRAMIARFNVKNESRKLYMFYGKDARTLNEAKLRSRSHHGDIEQELTKTIRNFLIC
jgi:hypothetical protein